MSKEATARSFSVTGIIIRTKEFGESDRFITLYTPDRGKITCVAKGIRSFKSRRSPQIELLNRVRTELWKSNRNYYLKQTVAEERFKELKKDMASLTSALFIAEITERLTPEEEPHEIIFNLLEEALSLIGFYPEQHPLLRETFVLKFLQAQGSINHFRHCAKCQKILPPKPAYIETYHLHLFCLDCMIEDQTVNTTFTEVPLETLKLIHFILKHPLLAVLKLKIENKHRSTLQYFGRLFLEKTLHYPLKSEAFLNAY